MGRKLEFEPGDAVQKAMMVFWEKGYERASVNEIEAGTGVGRKSLYRAFQDKEELFLAALANYRRYMADENLASLERPGADVSDIKALLNKLVNAAGNPIGTMGCLICNTAVELSRDLPMAAKHVDAYFEQIRHAMTHALQGSVEKGDLTLSTDEIARQANFLLGVIQSLCVLARAGAPKSVLQDVVSSALDRLH